MFNLHQLTAFYPKNWIPMLNLTDELVDGDSLVRRPQPQCHIKHNIVGHKLQPCRKLMKHSFWSCLRDSRNLISEGSWHCKRFTSFHDFLSWNTCIPFQIGIEVRRKLYIFLVNELSPLLLVTFLNWIIRIIGLQVSTFQLPQCLPCNSSLDRHSRRLNNIPCPDFPLLTADDEEITYDVLLNKLQVSRARNFRHNFF